MSNKFHRNLTDFDNHAVTAKTYSTISSRDDDDDFFGTFLNLNKIVRVENNGFSEVAYYLLEATTPVWLEITNTSVDTFIQLLDTPPSYVIPGPQSGKVVKVIDGVTPDRVEFSDTLIIDETNKRVKVGFNGTALAKVHIQNQMTPDIGLIIEAIVGQTGNLLEIRDENISPNRAFFIGFDGTSVFENFSDSTSGFQVNDSSGIAILRCNTTDNIVLVDDGLTVNTDSLIVEPTSQRVTIGNTAAGLTNLTIFQKLLTTSGLTFSGHGAFTGDSTTDGATIFIDNNASVEKHLFFSRFSDFGNPLKHGLFFRLGVDVPNIDAGAMDGGLLSNFNLAGSSNNVGVGFSAAVQADIIAKLHVKLIDNNVIGLRVQAANAQAANIVQVVDSAQSHLFLKIEKEGRSVFRNSVNSTTGFQIFNSSAITVPTFNVDTLNERIGITTNIPTAKLHIDNLAPATKCLKIDAPTGQSVNIFEIFDGLATPLFEIGPQGQMIVRIKSSQAQAVEFKNLLNVPMLTIDSANNRVGIQRTNPLFTLDVAGDGKFLTNLTVDNNFTVAIDVFKVVGTNVGINTTGTPAVPLDVVGTTRISANLEVFGDLLFCNQSLNKVGIKVGVPSQELHVNGNIRVTGAYFDSANNSGLVGQVLASLGGAAGTFWSNIGAGDVVGTPPSTNNAVAKYDGTTGIKIQNSGVIIDVMDNVTIPGDVLIQGSGQIQGSALILAGAAANVVLTVQGFAAQSAALMELKNNVGVVFSQFDSNGRLSIGLEPPLSDFTIRQRSGTASFKGINITGLDLQDVGNNVAGIAMLLGKNTLTGGFPRQELFIMDIAAVGDNGKPALKFVFGPNNETPNIQGITGNGGTNIGINLGSQTAFVGVGHSVAVTQAALLANLHVKGGTGNIIMILEALSTPTASMLQIKELTNVIDEFDEQGRLTVGGPKLVSQDERSTLDVRGTVAVQRTPTAVSISSLFEVIIGVTDLTIGRTITMSSQSISGTSGRIFIIKDETGNASNPNPITIETQGLEKIDGVDSVEITTPFGVVRLYSDGTDLFSW